MPMLIADHQLVNFDEWLPLFSANPPPPIGTWRLLRSTDDPNRVYVIGEFAAEELDEVKAFFESETMLAVFRQVDAMSDRPLEFIWLDDA